MRFEKRGRYCLDNETGLKWEMRTLTQMTWNDAIIAPVGWRLPTLEELLLVFDYNIHNPATKLPGMIASYYWSSTTFSESNDLAWYVDFYYGSSCYDHKSRIYCARYVKED